MTCNRVIPAIGLVVDGVGIISSRSLRQIKQGEKDTQQEKHSDKESENGEEEWMEKGVVECRLALQLRDNSAF